MAWQLIYTSAPRLLEAGRSGFGTVARHRAISPLLASAIERASQFSRLQGADAGRVIFCYRIIAAAGGRFHVLSSIRDAGADYTGRTNHIAHHLIADPREIAQLGANGPSPADVLLAMNWTASWSEPPRYLETADEVALAALRPPGAGSAWAQITGSPDSAQLLASGDASRGAYIIQPDRVDLREVFAESLRLMPERLWQISFTTSLQPSDEPADFRWIGIEERSPLRAQTEISGRPILNLADPGTLPQVEMPQFARADQIPQSSAPAPAASKSESRTASPILAKRAPVKVQPSPGSTPREKAAAAVPTSSRTRWLLTLTLAAIVLIVALVFISGLIEQQNERKEVAASFMSTGYFPDETCQSMAASLIASSGALQASELASASNNLAKTLLTGNLAELQSAQTSGALELLENRAGQQLPEELGGLRETVKHARQLSSMPSDFKDAAAQTRFMDERRGEISKLPLLKKPLQRLVEELYINADRQQAAGLLAMLNQPLPPPEGGNFEHAVESIAAKISDAQALQTIQDIKTILHERSSQQAADPKPQPAMADSPPSQKKPASGEKAALLPPVPLYFLHGKESLSGFHIKELGLNLKYFLKAGITAKEIELGDLNKNGALRRSVAGDLDFEVNEAKKEIALASGAASLAPPFRLSAQDAKRSEVFQIWVCAASGEALYPARASGIERKGNSLEINPAALGLTGTPKNQLAIKLPESCSVTTISLEALTLANWSVDLSTARSQAEAQLAQWQQKRVELEKRVVEPLKDDQAGFNELAVKLEKEADFTTQEYSYVPADPAATLRARCGGYIMAVAQTPTSPGFDTLFTMGADLKKLEGKVPAVKETEIIRVIRNKLRDAAGNLKTQKEAKLKSRLDLLDAMLVKLLPETPESQAKRKQQREAWLKEIDILKVRLSQGHPLISDRVPPGTYRLFARDGGADMLLVEIQIPQPSR